MRSKTVILVTHQIQFIKKATKILVLKDGKPLTFGKYEDLINSGLDSMSLLKEEKESNKEKEKEIIKEKEIKTEQNNEQFLKKRSLSPLSTKSQVIKQFIKICIINYNKF